MQAYLTLTYTQRVYEGTVTPPKSSPKGVTEPRISPVTSLSARTFGTWTLLSSIIRLYAAYNISNPLIYQLAICTYAIAWGHFMSEWLIFGTAKWGRGLVGPVCVATGSLVWMTTCWAEYVR